MNFAQRVADAARRAATIKKWRKRIDAIKTQNKTSMRKFCDKHKIDVFNLSHIMSGRRGCQWPFIRKVEKALAKEEKAFQ